MKAKLLLFLFITGLSLQLHANDKILYYFNHPVDTTVSRGVKAVYLNHCMADTLVAYINRAKYTIDIAQYDYNQNSNFANIATAINNAYNRGVIVRWIYDGSSSNTGLNSLNSAIYTLPSPQGSSYNIMHNKFVILDANSATVTDATIWTGSFDWSDEQFNSDYNNALIVQDSALAHAYTDEFNMMWGDTGIAPNSPTSKFGPYKTDLGRHQFTIGGENIELYFSPSDGTDSHIQSTIATANTDMYFGVYTFTVKADANAIVARKNAGVYVAGIMDQYSEGYSAYNVLNSDLSSSQFKVYASNNTIYHNKFLIVDPSNYCSDPIALTGSHNWSTAANTQNDENTLIIHDSTAANIYYQSFHADFQALGGSLSTVAGCSTGVNTVTEEENAPSVYPNPSSDMFSIAYDLHTDEQVKISLSDIAGRTLTNVVDGQLQHASHYQYTCQPAAPGIYFITTHIGTSTKTLRIIKLN